jgi:alpha-amylase
MGITAWIAAIMLGYQPPVERAWDDQIVYGIILEKFSDADPSNNLVAGQFGRDRAKYEGGFWGGDIRGITSKLGDLAELGVTAIIVYPVMRNDEAAVGGKYLPTGYRPKDYETVDPNFGTVDDLRAMVERAHALGLRVILDMPITLPGFEHPYLADPSKKDWFAEKTQYGVPRWKVENPLVADFIIGVAKRWKERSGCDGFRLDSAHLQPTAFWKRFVAEVKASPPTDRPFVILPELTVPTEEVGQIVAEAGFDGAYDFSVLRVRDVLGRDADVASLDFAAKEAHQFYTRPRSMLAPIDNYELAFVAYAHAPKEARTRLALTYILTLDRVPLLYAGNELGIEVKNAGDAFPDDRQERPFYRDVHRLIALRRKLDVLRHGAFVEVAAADGVYAYLRVLGSEQVLVVLNGSSRTVPFHPSMGPRRWAQVELVDLLSDEGETALVKRSGAAEPLRVEPYGGRVLRVR